MADAMQGEKLPLTARSLDRRTWLALFITLVIYPAAWCAGYIGPIIVEIYRGSRAHWWYFWLAALAFHWIPFAAVWWTLKKNGKTWSSIGVNWR